MTFVSLHSYGITWPAKCNGRVLKLSGLSCLLNYFLFPIYDSDFETISPGVVHDDPFLSSRRLISEEEKNNDVPFGSSITDKRWLYCYYETHSCKPEILHGILFIYLLYLEVLSVFSFVSLTSFCDPI